MVQTYKLTPDERAPVLKEYLKQAPAVKPYVDVTLKSPLEVFEAEAPRHPVFRVVGPATSSSE
jgi:hypothetical protein